MNQKGEMTVMFTSKLLMPQYLKNEMEEILKGD